MNDLLIYFLCPLFLQNATGKIMLQSLWHAGLTSPKAATRSVTPCFSLCVSWFNGSALPRSSSSSILPRCSCSACSWLCAWTCRTLWAGGWCLCRCLPQTASAPTSRPSSPSACIRKARSGWPCCVCSGCSPCSASSSYVKCCFARN